ncbi:MAG TPA: RimK family protein [Burkholderiaceae bacterium]|nr:RimK family protein [Burkholderiaceae bacterium]
MNIIFVVSHLRDCRIRMPGVDIVPMRTYLMDAAYCGNKDIKVFNLCRSYRYQKHGYYVSLLAEARGHNPLPDVKAIEDLHSDRLTQLLVASLDQTIQSGLAQIHTDVHALDFYFGRDAERCHEQLGEQLFNLLRIPLLHVQFKRCHGRWRVQEARALDITDIAPCDLQKMADAATDCVKGHQARAREPAAKKPALAILYTREECEKPSNAGALRKFREAAEMLDIRTEIITRNDSNRLTQFDALFIRDTTSVNHYTYQFARQAALAGLVVLDDPDSILKCSNKIYLAELLNRHGIPTPKTMMVHYDNLDDIVPALGLPCILKQPDSAFSIGVEKIDSQSELEQKAHKLFEKSELILAQEYVPTGFDWRIGILDRQPLFACKYFMVPGHWQIIQHDGKHAIREGITEAVNLCNVPGQVIRMALEAANLVGDGFYGVDLKQRGQHCCVIEINDNPNVDEGNEDVLLQDALYRDVMHVFRKRIEARKGNTVS